MDQPITPTVVTTTTTTTDPEQMAHKLAKIGLLLRKQGQPDALATLQRSLHLHPNGSSAAVWKSLGHALAQDGIKPEAACAAFRAAIAVAADSNESGSGLSSRPSSAASTRDDTAARTGLATVLAQLGRAGAATDELLHVRRDESSVAASLMAEPFERLCRRLMPAHRWGAAQRHQRLDAWERALAARAVNSFWPTGVLDISSTPIAALLAARIDDGALQPIVRVERLPLTITRALLEANGLFDERPLTERPRSRPSSPPTVTIQDPTSPGETPSQTTMQEQAFASRSKRRAQASAPVRLIAATSTDDGNLPPNPESWARIHNGELPSMLIADTDAIDIMGSCNYLTSIQSARDLLEEPDEEKGGRRRRRRVEVAPEEVVLHAALVSSTDLLKLNAITEEHASQTHGLDLTALNELSHRTRAVRLSELEHTMLTKPTAAMSVRLDGDKGVHVQGEESATLHVINSGEAHAIVVWHTMILDNDCAFSTSPFDQIDDDPTVKQAVYWLWPPVSEDELDWGQENEAADRSAANAKFAATRARELARSCKSLAKHAESCVAPAEKLLKSAEKKFEVLQKKWLEDEDAEEEDTQVTAAQHRVTRLAEAAANARGAALAAGVAAAAASDEAIQAKAAAGLAKEAAGKHNDPDYIQTAKKWEDTALAAANAALAAREAASDSAAVASTATEKDRWDKVRSMVKRLAVVNALLAIYKERSVDAGVELAEQAAEAEAKAEEAKAAAAKAKARPTVSTIGSVPVTAGEALTLRLRWWPKKLEMQLVSADGERRADLHSSASVWSDEAGALEAAEEAAAEAQAVGAVLLDENGEIYRDPEDGRFFPIPNTVHRALVKLRLRDGWDFETEEKTEIPRGTRVRVLERKFFDGVERAWVVLDGELTALGWLTSVNREGSVNLGEGRMSLWAKKAPVVLDDADESASAAIRKTARRAMMNAPASDELAKPKEIKLLARTGPDSQRVSSQNFGRGSETALADYHWPMLNDSSRNDAFASAIYRAVQKHQPKLTLDIGCGTGLLSMLAAKAGAKNVLGVEMSPQVALLATRLVQSHGLDHAVKVLSCHSSQLRLGADASLDKPDAVVAGDGRKAELLIFEILGTDPFCEGLLPALKDAKERLLTPDAVILPCELVVNVALVQSTDLIKLNAIAEESNTNGLDLQPL